MQAKNKKHMPYIKLCEENIQLVILAWLVLQFSETDVFLYRSWH